MLTRNTIKCPDCDAVGNIKFCGYFSNSEIKNASVVDRYQCDACGYKFLKNNGNSSTVFIYSTLCTALNDSLKDCNKSLIEMWEQAFIIK